MTEQADAQVPQEAQTGQPEQVESGGVVVKINPKLGITHGGVVIPGEGKFKGGERISKSKFNELEKSARRRNLAEPDGFPYLVKEDDK